MLLKSILFFFISLSTSLVAIDSITISAALCHRTSEERIDLETCTRLFEELILSLNTEDTSPDSLELALETYEEFLDGRDVQNNTLAIWRQLLNEEQTAARSIPSLSFDLAHLGNREIKKNPLITSKHYKAIKPWILPENHPMKARLDAIFQRSRAIQDAESFAAAGFQTFKVQPRSFIRVARHPDLPGYVLKVYLDTELRKKKGKPGWSWFAKRCVGAKKIQDIIKKKQIKHFKVTHKWIYPIPLFSQTLSGPNYDPKAEILIAEDMNIVSNEKSIEAWKTVMTPAHLDELYLIIAFAGGHSYRPDNIPYSLDGKFAFIDTEYPDLKPDFKTSMMYFSPEMVQYWQKLIDQGGPNKR